MDGCSGAESFGCEQRAGRQVFTPKKSVQKPTEARDQTPAVHAAQSRPSYEAYAVADYGSGQILEAEHAFALAQASLTRSCWRS